MLILDFLSRTTRINFSNFRVIGNSRNPFADRQLQSGKQKNIFPPAFVNVICKIPEERHTAIGKVKLVNPNLRPAK